MENTITARIPQQTSSNQESSTTRSSNDLHGKQIGGRAGNPSAKTPIIVKNEHTDVDMSDIDHARPTQLRESMRVFSSRETMLAKHTDTPVSPTSPYEAPGWPQTKTVQEERRQANIELSERYHARMEGLALSDSEDSIRSNTSSEGDEAASGKARQQRKEDCRARHNTRDRERLEFLERRREAKREKRRRHEAEEWRQWALYNLSPREKGVRRDKKVRRPAADPRPRGRRAAPDREQRAVPRWRREEDAGRRLRPVELVRARSPVRQAPAREDPRPTLSVPDFMSTLGLTRAQ